MQKPSTNCNISSKKICVFYFKSMFAKQPSSKISFEKVMPFSIYITQPAFVFYEFSITSSVLLSKITCIASCLLLLCSTSKCLMTLTTYLFSPVLLLPLKSLYLAKNAWHFYTLSIICNFKTEGSRLGSLSLTSKIIP